MDDKKILEIINKHCIIKDDKKSISCSIAFKIADETDVNVMNIGELCNKEKIKIAGCRLGCF